MKKCVLCFDIDGTICETTNADYTNAKPYKDMINLINNLYDSGNTIILHTARGSGQFNGDFEKIHRTFYSMTVEQLKCWGLKFHRLYVGKPYYDVCIDDKAFRVEDDGSSVEELRLFVEHKLKLI